MNLGSNISRRLLSKMRRPFTLCVLCGLSFLPMFILFGPSIRFSEGPRCDLAPTSTLKPGNHVDNSLDLWHRTDVMTCTAWRAPIMWDGMFDPDIYDKHHKKMGTSVALTVFAVGRYLEMYLSDLLTSAERYFMAGLPVTYYVFTDAPENVSRLTLREGRTLEIVPVMRHKRWQDVSMMRMKAIADAIQMRIRHRSRYVFCLDVDQVFVGRFGSEALGESVALLHSSFFNVPKEKFTYDRNPNSTAFLKTGDFYYHAAVFGGTWEKVQKLTESCHQGIMTDKRKQVEALWHDESHLNKYFWLHKPSKVLSPEYGWNPLNGESKEIHVKRLLWAKKHYDILHTSN